MNMQTNYVVWNGSIPIALGLMVESNSLTVPRALYCPANDELGSTYNSTLAPPYENLWFVPAKQTRVQYVPRPEYSFGNSRNTVKRMRIEETANNPALPPWGAWDVFAKPNREWPKITVGNPKNEPLDVTVRVGDRSAKIQLPGGERAGVSVTRKL